MIALTTCICEKFRRQLAPEYLSRPRVYEPNPMPCFFKRIASLAAILAVFSFPAIVRAADFYIAQNALGAGTGADAADAAGVSFFNNSGSWNSPTKVSGKIGPGDIVHLVGTISSSLAVEAGGTAGNAITILFSPGARLSAPTWPSGA